MSVNPYESEIGTLRELPAEFNEKTKLLDAILTKGIEKLLTHARKHNILKPPYGHPEQPTPLITQEEFVKSGAWKDDNNNVNVEFKYDYGFNPLRYLAEYIKWAHPHSVDARYRAKQAAFEKLKCRGQHAIKYNESRNELLDLYTSLQSGLIWGPYTSPISENEIVFICQPIKNGSVSIQIATDPSFTNVFLSQYKYHASYEFDDDISLSDFNNQEYPIEFIPFKTNIDGLQPGTKYYLRCRVDFSTSLPAVNSNYAKTEVNKSSNNISSQQSINSTKFNDNASLNSMNSFEEFKDMNINNIASPREDEIHLFYQECSFSTLFTDEDSGSMESQETIPEYKPIVIIGLGIDPLLQLDSTVKDIDKYLCISDYKSMLLSSLSPENEDIEEQFNKSLFYSCLLGDPYASRNALNNKHSTYPKSLYINFYRDLYFMSSRCNSIVKNSSFFLGWNDTRHGCDSELRQEERLYKQFKHDVRKYEKKYKKQNKSFGARLKQSEIPSPPVLQRGPLSPSLKTIIESFPITTSEKATVSTYRSVYIGSDVQIFILDSRKGYLGKHQAKVLCSEIEKSFAKWKIVLYGVPFGVYAYKVENLNLLNNTDNKIATSLVDSNTDSKANASDGSAQLPSALVNHVSMTLPDAAEHDGVDSEGRSHSSLQYVIAKLQSSVKETGDDDSSEGNEERKSQSKTANDAANKKVSKSDKMIESSSLNKKKSDLTKDNLKQLESYTGQTVNEVTEALNKMQLEDNEVNGKNDVVTDENKDEADDRNQMNTNKHIYIKSGIVLLTGGLQRPFVATYDPNSSGQAYACEVNSGSCSVSSDRMNHRGIDSSQDNVAGANADTYDDIRIEPMKSMVPSFAYNAYDDVTQSGSSNAKAYWSVLSLLEDGNLSVKILSRSKVTTADDEFVQFNSSDCSLDYSVVLGTQAV